MVCIFAIPVNLLANFSFQTEMKILIIHFVLLLLLHIPGFRFSLVPTPLHKSTATGENTVLGLASYPKNSLKLFKRLIGSLRNSNFQGHVILGVHPTISELEVEYLKRNQVTMYVVEAVSCEEKSIPRTTSKRKSPTIRSKCAKGLETLKLEWGRYELARQWLNACEECTGWTLVLDTRDVFFQGDPFQAIDDMKLSPLTQLIFIQEISPSTSPVNDSSRSFIAGNQRSESHTVPCYGWTTFRHYSHQPVLCSGTIFGTREGMDKFLSTLVKEFHENNQKENHRCYSPSTTDQWTLNWMYYNNKFGTEPQVVTVPWGYGPVNTIGKVYTVKTCNFILLCSHLTAKPKRFNFLFYTGLYDQR